MRSMRFKSQKNSTPQHGGERKKENDLLSDFSFLKYKKQTKLYRVSKTLFYHTKAGELRYHISQH